MNMAIWIALNSVLAGVTLPVAILNIWLYLRDREQRAPLFLGLLALSQITVLLSGAGALFRATPAIVEVLLFIRSGLLGVSVVLAVLALGSLVPGLRTAPTAIALSGLVLLRMTLWLTTDSVVQRPIPADGWPTYGPGAWLSLVYGLGLLAFSIRVMRRSSGHVRQLLIGSAVVTSAMAVPAGILQTGPVFEQLITFGVVPAGTAILLLGARRIVQTAQARDRLAIRQSALAEVGRTAVRAADVEQVRLDAELLLRRQLERPDAVLLISTTNESTDDDAAVFGRRCIVSARGVDTSDPAAREFVGSLLQVVAASADRSAADADLAHNATHDGPTGLPNSVLLLDRLAARLSIADGSQTVLFLIGLPGLDDLVSVEGHHVAGALVNEVADRLRESAEPGSTVGRWSSDVFAVVEAGPPGDPSAFLRRRLAELDQALAGVFSRPSPVAVRIGAVVGTPEATPDTLYRDATAALRRAVAAGRPEIFDDELGARLRAEAETERDLRHAVERDEIEVHYQPIFSPDGTTIRSYEALARWRRGPNLVPPFEWIPVAEASGLIADIGLHVLRIAVRDQVVLGAPIAVNVSPLQLADPHFDDSVFAVLGDCPRERISLEVTESALMADLDRAVAVLHRLRDGGIRIALDDFGTSYSSLGVLVALPIDVLKIDRVFVQALDTASGQSVVEAIVTLARTLGKSTVAEGVETPAQLEALAAAGADRIQGFLTGRPAPLAAHVPSAAH